MTRILLVEDDKSIVTNLTEFLQKEGFAITSVDGQTKALALLETSAADFDLLLLDVSLAEGTAVAICRAVKSTTSLPVIFLTASSAGSRTSASCRRASRSRTASGRGPKNSI